MDKKSISPKKAALYISIVFIVVVSIVTAIYLFVNRGSNITEYENSLSIANLSDYTDGKPTDQESVAFIENALYDTVNLNSEDTIESGSISDILIRDGSFTQDYNEDTTVHSVSFIVDISSLRQSYKASYQWSDENPTTFEIDEWGTMVLCLPEDQLIYEPFNCRDTFTEMSGTGDPQISSNLPYNSNFYRIGYYVADNLETTLSIQIMTSTNSEQSKQRFEIYKSDALKWLRDNDINPDKYTLEFRNFSNTLVSITARKE